VYVALQLPAAFVTTFLVYLLIGLIILRAAQRAAEDNNPTAPKGRHLLSWKQTFTRRDSTESPRKL